MPDSCCAVGCFNKRTKESKLKFFRIPFGTTEESLDLRKKWVTAIKRENWTEEQIDNARLCSQHFLSGERSKDPSHPDFVPSVFFFNTSTDTKKKLSLDRHERYSRRKLWEDAANESESNDFIGFEENSSCDFEFECKSTNTDMINVAEKSCQTELLLNNHPNPTKLLVDVLASNSLLNFYTGLPDSILFEFVLEQVQRKDVYVSSKLTLQDHLLLVLMKLKLGSLHADIAYRFSLTSADVSRIYKSWILHLANVLEFLIVWPERDALRLNLPSCFKKFRNCVCIIDCTEIFIERPLDLTARAQTWSNYKHHNTIKYLIGITPAGAVSFLSQGWGGRVSDKELTMKSNFLKKIQHGDSVLADRGFTIDEELATCGATLAIPNFTRGKAQMSAKEVEESRKISNVRIHVERVIGRLRKFKILQTTIPITQVKMLDAAMVVICALVNLNDSVVT